MRQLTNWSDGARESADTQCGQDADFFRIPLLGDTFALQSIARGL